MRLKASLRYALANPVFLEIAAFLFFAPLVVLVGQFWTSGFLGRSVPVPLLFWPGVHWHWAVVMPGWLAMGIIAVCYLSGIEWLIRKRTLGIVAVCGFGIMALSVVLQKWTVALSGWTEQQSPWDLAGKVDLSLYSSAQNALWEELVFRGVPLLILLYILKKWPLSASWSKLAYLLVPSVLFAAYHVPNHGPVRILNTFVFGVCLAWMALRYGLLASVLVHLFGNVQRVWHLGTLPDIPASEIAWIVRNDAWLQIVQTGLTVALFAAIPVLILWYLWRSGKNTDPVA